MPVGARDSISQPVGPEVPFDPPPVDVYSTRSNWPVRADSSMTFAPAEVTTTFPSAVTSAAGIDPSGPASGDPTGRDAIRSRPAPVSVSSRYPVCCPGGGVRTPACHSNATRSLPTQDTLNGAPFARVVQELTAPVAIVTTRIPVYGQLSVLALQCCTSIASLVPSGDSATSVSARYAGTLTGSLLSFAERPLAATRSR